MSSERAMIFLRQNKIAYVYFGDQERALSPSARDLSYPSLTRVFQSGNTVVYKVNGESR